MKRLQIHDLMLSFQKKIYETLVTNTKNRWIKIFLGRIIFIHPSLTSHYPPQTFQLIDKT